MELPYFKLEKEIREKKRIKNLEFNKKKTGMNEKYGFDPSKQKMETEEYKYDKLLLDKLAAEKKALEEQ